MAIFGHFEFKAKDAGATYEGDYMEMDKGYVSIFLGDRNGLGLEHRPELVVTIHLDKGQSVRKIK